MNWGTNSLIFKWFCREKQFSILVLCPTSGLKGALRTHLCFCKTSAAKCALLQGGWGCCSVCFCPLVTCPSLASPRHPCGPASSVSCRLGWGCARPPSDCSALPRSKSVPAPPMNDSWMTFSTGGTTFGRWVTDRLPSVDSFATTCSNYLVSKPSLLKPLPQILF